MIANKIKSFLIKSKFRLFLNPYNKYIYNKNGNRYVCKGNLINSPICIKGRNNTIIIDEDVLLKKVKIFINGNNNTLHIRKGVKFYDKGQIEIHDEGNILDIGKNTYSTGSTTIIIMDFNNTVTIGSKCMFAKHTVIRNSDAHSIIDSEGKRINPGRNIQLGNHVWLGYGATVLKGTILGDDSIVGTQAVISGNKPQSGCIYAGNPAKLVKENINWVYERRKE